MPGLFDDLIPQGNGGPPPGPSLSFDDLVRTRPVAKKPSLLADIGQSLASGVNKGGASLADAVLQANPVSQTLNALTMAGNLAGIGRGQPVVTAPPAPQTIPSQVAARIAYQPQTTAGRYADSIGQHIPNALLPGSAMRRVANVVVPAITSEAAAQAAKAAGAGPRGQTAARIAGDVAGSVGASFNPQALAPEARDPMTALAKQDPQAMRQAAEDYRGAGIEPTIADVVDDSGRGLIRAAANRNTPARGEANKFVAARALNLPDRIDRQASTFVSPETASPAQLQADIASRIAEAATPPEVAAGSGGMAVSAKLNQQYDAAKSAVDDAYQAARAAAPEAASIPRAETPQIAANIRDAVRDFHPDDMPAVARELNKLDQSSGLTVRDLYEMRQRLNAVRQAKPDQAVAAGKVIGALDGQIADVADRGVITGDPEVIGLWRNAIAQRRQFGQRFQGGDMIQQLTEREPRAGVMSNAVAPEDASALILGRNGVAARLNSARDLARLRDTLGANSPEWQALQNEASARLLQGDAGRETYGQSLDRFTRQNPDMADLLIHPDHRDAVSAARQQIDAATADRRALELGGSFVQPGSADSFSRAAPQLEGQSADLARAAARRSIAVRAGENVSQAPTVASRLANAPEQQARNAALLGPDQAGRFQNALRLEGQAVQNAADIAPRSGPRTFLNAADENAMSGAQTAMNVGKKVLRRDWFGLAGDFLRARGISNGEAEQLVNMSIDPNQTDAAIAMIERRLGANAARRYLELKNAGAVGGASAARDLVAAP